MGNMNFAQSEWRTIDEFPRYEINAVGIIRKRKNSVQVAVQHNGYIEVVKLYRNDGKRYLRSVGKLARAAFPELYP